MEKQNLNITTPNDIKIGETYNVRVKVTAISENRFVCRPLLWNGTMSDFAPNFFNFAEAEAFYKSIPEQPKYDPCREFRKGDIVTPKERNGRIPWAKDMMLTVISDERSSGVTVRDEETGEERFFCVLFLELVTPVEELGPYYIEKHGEKPGGLCYTVHKHGGYAESSFYYGTCRTRDEAQAKAAAEAERDRLNAEYRKEQSND